MALHKQQILWSDGGFMPLHIACHQRSSFCDQPAQVQHDLPGVAITDGLLHLRCYPVLSVQAVWANAGNLKLTFPIAIAATQLAWGMIAAPGGLGGTRSTAAHLASLKWGTDYLMACRPSTTDFVAQARSSTQPSQPKCCVVGW